MSDSQKEFEEIIGMTISEINEMKTQISLWNNHTPISLRALARQIELYNCNTLGDYRRKMEEKNEKQQTRKLSLN